MKVCFVVLAHHQPEVFKRLIENISWLGADVVIHIDRDADIEQFRNPGRPNVRFMERRNKVKWSGWSLTRAIVSALECGIEFSDADYFMYLAGTDFPIQGLETLRQFLSNRYPANFLNWYPLVPGVWGYGLIERIYLNDQKSRFMNLRDPCNGQKSDPHNYLGNSVIEWEKQLNKRYYPRDTSWTRFYSGSSRWCLNRETVSFLIDYYHSGASGRLKDFLRLSANSDEIFFQTAILNSRHKAQCVGFDESLAEEIFEKKRPAMPDEMRVYLHYIDWNPQREDPAILVEGDLKALDESGKFFASKFTDDKSLGLIEILSSRLGVSRVSTTFY